MDTPTLEKDTLNKIRSWYKNAYESMETDAEYRKARWYLLERIRTVNLMLMQSDEKDYLTKLDSLFLLDIDRSDETDFKEVEY